MKNKDIWDLLQFICNKEQSGNTLTPDQFNSLFIAQQKRYVEFLLSEYERTKKIGIAFQKLRTLKTPDLHLDSNGFADLPTDYLFTDVIEYLQTIGSDTYSRIVDECTGQEFKERKSDYNTLPTEKHPISQLIGDKIQVEPLRNSYLKFQYIRRPKDPYLDWYVDGYHNLVFKEEQVTGQSGIVYGDTYGQISNLVLTGITELNSDQFFLYWNLSFNSYNDLYELFFFKDSSKQAPVAFAQLSSSGNTNIISTGGSGITGSVTLAIQPYYTLSGNGLGKILSSILNGVKFPLLLYWELKCIPNLVDGYSIETQFNLYLNSSKGALFSSSSLNGVEGTLNISGPNGETGTVTIINAFAMTISSVSVNKNILSNFRLSQIVFNYYIFYYALIDTGNNLAMRIYSDSSMNNEIMSGSVAKGQNAKVVLTESNFSGFNGIIHINSLISNAIVINGDAANQISNFIMQGLGPNNSDAGTLYWDLGASKIWDGSYPQNWMNVVQIVFYKNSLKRPQDVVAWGQYDPAAGWPQTVPAGVFTIGAVTGLPLHGADGHIFWTTGDTFDQQQFYDPPYTSPFIQIGLDLNYSIDDINAGNTIIATTTSYAHTGQIDYTSGAWTINNTIQVIVDMDSENKFLFLTDSLTVECELTDESKMHILGMILKDIGRNLSSKEIEAYADNYIITSK
jgi:hypothetical protein